MGTLIAIAALASTHVAAVTITESEELTSSAQIQSQQLHSELEDKISLSVSNVTTLQAVDAQASALPVDASPVPASTAWPPSRAEVIAQVRATFAEDPDTAERIVLCESGAGQHPRTYDLTAGHAGPMQLAKSVWEPFFRERYGWDWSEVVRNLSVHLKAARIVWERGTWAAWDCY